MSEISTFGKVKPAQPGGFNDFHPASARIREDLLHDVTSVFKRFGFVPLETPVIEFRDVLIGEAGETEKEIFDISGKEEEKKLSMRFDLTVGLSRYVAANPDLVLPFKRYQVGQVFRGEKPQAGRYRQFSQLDLDIVGTRSMMAEAEILTAMRQALQVFGPGEFYYRINHRALLEGLAQKVNIAPNDAFAPIEQTKQLMRVLDKLEKIGMDEVRKELGRAPADRYDNALHLTPEALDLVERFLTATGTNEEILATAEALVGDTEQGKLGLADLRDLVKYLGLWGLDNDKARIDLSVARGLDYYTGPVFETTIVGGEQWGSVMSGGRYDDLVARFSGQQVPAVGGSIGFDRLFRLLSEEQNTIKPSEQPMVDAVVMLFDDCYIPAVIDMAKRLQEGGISSEIAYTSDRSFKGQMNYALKRNAKYLLIYGDREEANNEVAVKNLGTRKQATVSLEGSLPQRIKDALE